MKHLTSCYIACMFMLGCSSSAPIPNNLVPEYRNVANYLADLGAEIGTGRDGNIIEVEFFYDPDANNPVVHNSDIVCLGGLPDLEILDLRKTAITDSGLDVVVPLTKLRSLALPRSITDEGIPIIRQLPLVHLDVDGCPITDKGLLHLSEMTTLESLNISNTQISDKGLQHLSNLKGLQCLLLSGTPLASGFEALNDLPALQVLDLGFTRISDKDLDSIQPTLTRLKVLCLQSTSITDYGLIFLHKSHLRNISLINTKVTDDGIKNLQKVLPTCEINKCWSTALNQ